MITGTLVLFLYLMAYQLSGVINSKAIVVRHLSLVQLVLIHFTYPIIFCIYKVYTFKSPIIIFLKGYRAPTSKPVGCFYFCGNYIKLTYNQIIPDNFQYLI